MSRLFGAKADEKRWKIKEIDNNNYHTYKLIDKEKEEIYILRNIIGLEQVSGNEFLVHKRYNHDECMITRYILEESEYIKIFEERFTRFEFIDDDRILFIYYDGHANYRSGGIYSITNNNYIEEGKWLDGKIIDIYNKDEIKMLVQIEIPSIRLGDKKLLFTVDPDTLEPNSDCYSSYRDNFIKVKTKEDIENIRYEDRRNIDYMSDLMRNQEFEAIRNAKEKILKNT